MTDLRILRKQHNLLQYLDGWFRSLQARYSVHIRCRQGCARCCLGLFDISLPDALRVSKAFAVLPDNIRSAIASRATSVHARILQAGAELDEPYFLNAISEEMVDRIIVGMQDVRCLFLDGDDNCLIYEDRPLACRLEGIPMVDSRDGLFGDWCELNFLEGLSPDLEEALHLDYYGIQAIEQEVTEHLSQYLVGSRQGNVTLFIPSVIAAFDSFWKSHGCSKF